MGAAATALALLVPVAATAQPVPPTIPQAPAAAADDPGLLDAGDLAYPGTTPGPATAQLDGDTLTFANAVLTATFMGANGGALTLGGLAGASGDLGVTGGALFRLSVDGGPELTPETMTVTSPPAITSVAGDADAARMSDQEDGERASVTYAYTSDGYDLEVVWQAELRDDANNLQQNVTVTNNGAAAVSISRLQLQELTATSARIVGDSAGSPVAIGPEGAEVAFAGVENPMAETTVDGNSITSWVDREGDLAAASTWQYSSSIGVTPPGQLRRAFTYYVERDRAHARRTFLHYQSWFDLKPPGLIIDSSELNEAIDLFGTELTDRGATIDSFWIDDGWDYLRAPQQPDETGLEVWDFDPVQFPDGFAPQKAEAATYDASLSVWMSPFGGYGESSNRRKQLNNSKPAGERLDTHGPNGGFDLGGERYYERFRDVVFDMMENQGVQGFKFDGIGGGLWQQRPNAAYVRDYEALLSMTGDMREHTPDVFINATVGTWRSPYWLWYVDSIWRDGHDAQQAGEGDPREKYVSYRDSITYEHTVTTNPLFPVTALMNHGFIFSERAPQFSPDHDLTKESVRTGVAADLRGYFAMGLSLQELYVRNTQVRPDQPGADWFWDEVAANARWSRENTDLLTDVHWVGGDAALGEVYGTAAWQNSTDGERTMIMLRNPSARAQSFAIDVGDVLELPDGAAGTYKFTARDGGYDDFVATADTDYHATLAPFQVVLLEGTPTDEPPTPSEPLPVDVALDRTGWVATTDSAESAGENGAAQRAIDGDVSTLWHTAYNPAIAQLPHQLTIDMGEGNLHVVGGLDHLPRQDAPDGNGTIKDYAVYTSLDGETWTEVARGTFDPPGARARVELTPTLARYVRLEALTTSKNGSYSADSGFASVAELNLYPATTLDRAGWTVSTDSEETDGEDGRATRSIDGNPATFWHTEYNTGTTEDQAMPHELVIDTHSENTLTGFDYLPRQDVKDANGTIAGYEFYVGSDGETWTKVAEGTFDPTGELAYIAFDPVEARYAKLVATSSANGTRFAGAAEVNLYGDPVETPAQEVLTEIAGVEGVTVTFGTSEAAALAALPAATTITTSLEGATSNREVTLDWALTDYDGTQAGDYTATATFPLPDGVIQGDHPMELQVGATVTVEAEALPTIAAITAVEDVTVAFGTTESNATATLPATTTITDSDGTTHTVTLDWTLTDYDGTQAGDYTATATFPLPDGVTQGDHPMELQVGATVTVSPEDTDGDDNGTTDTGADSDGTSDTGADTDGTTDTGADTDGTTDTGADTDGTSDTGADTDDGTADTGGADNGTTDTGGGVGGTTDTGGDVDGTTGAGGDDGAASAEGGSHDPEASAAGTGSDAGTDAGDGEGAVPLPDTGANVLAVTVTALLLLAAGAVFVRRRGTRG
ncbi:discoidin domain-containing protein [Pseudactinotalea sp. HY158]|uniref:discoidin domain-containing protein n=1 Tax=Pseudactinotalea sp. HY158 TaxID=2654547 RepID=UPI00129CFB41|nr:discoidin domain-containing protein [Pseudactinotalea sp. HY158]QGH70491.1 hypothetical protein GCE65_14070 [Pseudactinotalea sp. HY158]